MTIQPPARGNRASVITTITAIVAIAALYLSAPAAAAQLHTLSQGDGMRGKPSVQVRQVQRALERRGYSVGAPGPDGRFGPLTAAAVRRLQAARRLAVDGVVGRRTARTLGVPRPTARPAQPRADKRATAKRAVPPAATKSAVTPATVKPGATPAPAPGPGATTPARPVPGSLHTSSSNSVAPVLILAALALLAGVGLVALRRRRARRKDSADPAPEPSTPPQPEREAVIGYVTMAAGTTSDEHDRAAAAIAEACERSGRDLIEIICDSPGGRSLERPGLVYSLDRIADGQARGLIVSDLQSFTGSRQELANLVAWFRDADATLVALDLDLDTSTPAGRQVAATLMSLGGQGDETVSQADENGNGHASGNGRPAVRDRPELLEQIAAMRSDGMSLREIAERLNAEQVPTLRGGALWRPSSIQSALGYKRPGRHDRLRSLETRG